MSAKAEEAGSSIEWLRWLIVAVIVAAGIVGNSIYGEFPLIYRVLVLLVLAAAALWVASTTQKGGAIWDVIKESRTEIRKVVWPTRHETNQTSLIVVVLVIVTAFILWGLDSFFGWIASMIIG